MSEISVIGNAVVGSVPSTTTPTTKKTPVEATASTQGDVAATTADRVEFSQRALMLEKIHQMSAVRQERIDVIKEAISNDTYMTSGKLDIAFDRLIDEVTQ